MAKTSLEHPELKRVLPRLSELKPGRKELRRLGRCALELDRIGKIPKPKGKPKGQILVAALTQSAIRARGKVEPDLFFPDFLKRLAAKGYRPEFIFHADELVERTHAAPSCIIHLYGEERARPGGALVDEANAAARVVFNHPDTGGIIRNKTATNRYLTARGIRMPAMAFGAKDKVFSNAVDKTSDSVWLSEGGEVDADRYNTQFIDSRAAYEGTEYFNTIRLLTVGPEIVHAFIGARPAQAGKPGVHGVNTPKNAALIQYFYDMLYEANKDRMAQLAVDLDAALGHGFYHHDLIVEKGTGDIYLCETGYKFDAYAYGSRLIDLRDEAPCIEPFLSEAFARRSADMVIRAWTAAG